MWFCIVNLIQFTSEKARDKATSFRSREGKKLSASVQETAQRITQALATASRWKWDSAHTVRQKPYSRPLVLKETFPVFQVNRSVKDWKWTYNISVKNVEAYKKMQWCLFLLIQTVNVVNPSSVYQFVCHGLWQPTAKILLIWDHENTSNTLTSQVTALYGNYQASHHPKQLILSEYPNWFWNNLLFSETLCKFL